MADTRPEEENLDVAPVDDDGGDEVRYNTLRHRPGDESVESLGQIRVLRLGRSANLNASRRKRSRR